MKNDKLMDAFKAFEVKNQECVTGGTTFYRVTYQSGTGVCDLMNTSTGQETCNVKDTGAVGTVYHG